MCFENTEENRYKLLKCVDAELHERIQQGQLEKKKYNVDVLVSNNIEDITIACLEIEDELVLIDIIRKSLVRFYEPNVVPIEILKIQ